MVQQANKDRPYQYARHERVSCDNCSHWHNDGKYYDCNFISGVESCKFSHRRCSNCNDKECEIRSEDVHSCGNWK